MNGIYGMDTSISEFVWIGGSYMYLYIKKYVLAVHRPSICINILNQIELKIQLC